MRPYALVFGLIVLESTTICSTYAANEPKRAEDTWAPLQTEPSREQLFREFADEEAIRNSSGAQPFAYASKFVFKRDALYDENGNPRTDTYFGIDVSSYQGLDLPIKQMKSEGVSFIYVKATQGTNIADKSFGQNWTTLSKLLDDQKLPFGAYHFLSSSPDQSGADQADSFIDYVDLHGGFKENELRPAMDLEWDKVCPSPKCPDRWTTNGRSAEDIIKTSGQFVTRVKERIGKTPLIYTNKSFLRDHSIVSAEAINRLLSGAKVWIFDIADSDLDVEKANPRSNLDHDLWQFSWTGKINGPGINYQNYFDVDVFKGTEADFTQKLLSND